MSGPALGGGPLLRCRDVHKAYGAVRALRGASLEVAPATVHGIVGHNGAGKSTLVKVIGGYTDPDAGSVEFAGEEIGGIDRRGGIARGIGSVPQELTVLGEMTVADNVSVGNEPRRGPLVNRRALRRRASETLAMLGVDLPVDALVSDLSPSRQRMVMIATAVSRECRLLILDEPTASLGTDEAEPLLELVTRLTERGLTVLYISHRLDEVERLCDSVTIMRDGQTLETRARGEFTASQLVAKMVDELPARPSRPPRAGDREPLVRLAGIYGRSLRDIDLEIPAGAVTGFTGLVGSGADELLEVVAGATQPVAGRVEIGGRAIKLRSPADALRAGVGYVPGTRAEAALAPLTIRENVLASSYERIGGLGGLLPGRGERSRARTEVAAFDLSDRVEAPLSDLSGGNQQKVLFGRLIAADVRVIVVNDPTAGVDYRARADLHELLRQAADDGCAVIVRCSEPEELIDLADVVYALAGGRVAARFEGGELTVGKLLEASASSGRAGAAQ